MVLDSLREFRVLNLGRKTLKLILVLSVLIDHFTGDPIKGELFFKCLESAYYRSPQKHWIHIYFTVNNHLQ